jgi:hypothetical protein
MRALLVLLIAVVISLLGGPASAGFLGGSAGLPSPHAAQAAAPTPESPNELNPLTTEEVRNLFAGWNFVLWSSEGCEPIKSALGNVLESGGVSVVALFSPADQTWKLFDPAVPEEISSLGQICKNEISVLYVSTDMDWTQRTTVVTAEAYAGPLSIGAEVVVANTEGDCLNVRSAPSADVLSCLPEGQTAVIDDGPIYDGGHWWWRLAGLGWSAGDFLQLPLAPVDPLPVSLGIGAQVTVAYTDGYCLNMRATPYGELLSCISEAPVR